MSVMFSTIGLLSHLVATLGYAGLGIALALKRRPSSFRLAVALAALITAFWAAGHSIVAYYGAGSAAWVSEAETMRTAAWIAVLVVLQRHSWGLDERPSSSFAVALLLGFVVALQLMLDVLLSAGARSIAGAPLPLSALLFVVLRLVVAISGLVLLHNLYVNARESHALPFRLFAVSLGLIFAYDLNLYTLLILQGTINLPLVELRGAVNALAVPLLYLAVRGEADEGRFQLSRKIAFQTVSVGMIGAYLIGTATLAHGLKLTGGSWGELLQIAFLAVTLVAGALVFLSPRFRAELRVRIARNFYRYRYDYRAEWLRFIETIDGAGADKGMPIRERLVKAIATVLDSPGGMLLEPSDGGGFEQTARWRWPNLVAPRVAEGAAMSLHLAETGRIVDFDALRRDARSAPATGSAAPLVLPDWAAGDPWIWLAIPLAHRDRLTGILLLQRSLAPRALDWEDFDLLRTLGRQGASYLAEAETQAQLDEARSFDEFNRRFAFVMHDLKNVVSQLALVAKNAERHADNPDFRADMMATLNGSVTKMTDLLQLLGRQQAGKAAEPTEDWADLARIATIVTAQLRRQHPAIELEGADEPLLLPGDAGRLEAMLTHIVQNAIDASAPDAPVRIRLRAAGRQLRLSVADRGHGMSQPFIRDDLFRPFRSTKDGGFGIGAYEAREIVRAHGGRLDVSSRPGEGSRFEIVLPSRVQKERKVERA